MNITSFRGIKKARLRRDGLDEWVAVRMATGCRWHECLHPAPRCRPVLPGHWHQGQSIHLK